MQNQKLKIKNNIKKQKTDFGFTLLFASLIGSLVFTIGIAILNISLKQLTLTSAGRESQQSFYAADAGSECALLLDRGAGDSDCQAGFFGVASTSPSGISICDKDMDEYVTSRAGLPKCFGQDITITSVAEGDHVTSTFDLKDNPDTNICFGVTVTKTPNSDSSEVNSVIESRGYNTCSTGGTVFERAIKTYNY
ncbi:MAG: pilus assembly PilX N-terminal domain-containing protein [Patescibacteria group bacterium]